MCVSAAGAGTPRGAAGRGVRALDAGATVLLHHILEDDHAQPIRVVVPAAPTRRPDSERVSSSGLAEAQPPGELTDRPDCPGAAPHPPTPKKERRTALG